MLFLQAELGYDAIVALRTFAGQVVQEGLALRYHLQESSAGMVVFRVGLEVLYELLNLVGKDGNLHLGRAGVALMKLILYDNLFFLLWVQHRSSEYISCIP